MKELCEPSVKQNSVFQTMFLQMDPPVSFMS